MDENGDKDASAARTGSSTPGLLPDVSLDIERERLKLESERIAIERERLEAEREELEIREKFGKDPYDLTFGLTAICVVASICLVLGGIIGFTSGLDIGRSQMPPTRKVAVSREFTSMIKSVAGYKPAATVEARPTPQWIPGKRPPPQTSVIMTR